MRIIKPNARRIRRGFRLEADMRANSLNHMTLNHVMAMFKESALGMTLGHDGHFHKLTNWWQRENRYAKELHQIMGVDYDPLCPTVVMGGTLSERNLFGMQELLDHVPDNKVYVAVPRSIFVSDMRTIEKAISRRLNTRSRIDVRKRVIVIEPEGSGLYDFESVRQQIIKNPQIGMGVFTPINYVTGQRFDYRPIAEALQHVGAWFFSDEAHGMLNISPQSEFPHLRTACSYKYGGGTPGGVAIMAGRKDLFLDGGIFGPDYIPGGWWGVHENERFSGGHAPATGIHRFLLSNAQIFNMIGFEQTLRKIRRNGVGPYYGENEKMSTLLYESIISVKEASVITPAVWDEERGCQVSFSLPGLNIHEVLREMAKRGSYGEDRGIYIRATGDWRKTSAQIDKFTKDLKYVISKL